MDRRLYAWAGIRHVAMTAGGTSICSFRRYHRRMLFAYALAGQMAVALISGVVINIIGLASWNHPVFWLITSTIFIIGSLFSTALIIIAGRPLDDILTALIHKRGERTTRPLPNPNAEQHAKTGFKTVLELIYDEPAQPAPPPSPDALLTQALNHTSCGIVVLDPAKRIISANKAAPIATDANGQPYLALDFLNEQSLETWLSDADARQVPPSVPGAALPLPTVPSKKLASLTSSPPTKKTHPARPSSSSSTARPNTYPRKKTSISSPSLPTNSAARSPSSAVISMSSPTS